MAKITRIGRVLVPVADQDEAIALFTENLGFEKTADVPFGGNARWVEVGSPGGGASLALVPPQGDYQPGRMTGISLKSPDPKRFTRICRRKASTSIPISGVETGRHRSDSSSRTTTGTN